MKEKCILTMDRETAQTVSKACEFYSRIVFGQYEDVAWETAVAWPDKFHDPAFCSMRDQAEAALKIAKAAMFPELSPGSSYGVGHNRNSDTAWNVYQVIRYAFAWKDHPEGGYTVDFQKPMSFSAAPMPEFDISEDSNDESQN